MLKSYTVKGFKSFKEKATVDLTPTNYKILSDKNIYNDVLKGTMFIGANASGKSNIVLAVKILLDLLFAKYDVGLENYLCLFAEEQTIELDYDFSIENNSIHYSIQYEHSKNFLTEKLYLNDKLLLDRMATNAKSYISEEIAYTDISNDTLFLREIYFNTKFRNNDVLQKWFEFMIDSIYIDLYKQKSSFHKDVELNTNEYLDKNGTTEINDFLSEHHFEQTIEYKKENNDSNKLYFKRHGLSYDIPFPLESLGNQNLIMLLPKFFYTIKNGGMLILDEFSSGFHNDLEELLIKYFMGNTTNSQIIFVSHSTNLMKSSLLRPDQMYTVDFKDNGSILNRVSKQQPREAQNLEKMYLGGVFDGLPNYTVTPQ